jgi:hypothetical protein
MCGYHAAKRALKDVFGVPFDSAQDYKKKKNNEDD